jgi:hydroxyacylglutathione hydrolase
MRIQIIPCLSDNYGYLVVCEQTHEAAIVDASESGPILSALDDADVKLKAVWSTHHHHDHVGGNEDVRAKYGVDVYGHASDRGRLPGQTRFLESGETFSLGRLDVSVHHIPGHTLGAIAYVVKDGASAAVFTGDTMFVAGCGRMFEGTPEQMHGSLAWLGALDPATLVYCGHEYTENNLRFAHSIEPGNADVAAAMRKAKATRGEGKPTVPSTIADERRINPFLRAGSTEIRRSVGVAEGADDVTAFAAIRKAKDGFR